MITETIFAWPGVGRLSVQAIFNRDYPGGAGGGIPPRQHLRDRELPGGHRLHVSRSADPVPMMAAPPTAPDRPPRARSVRPRRASAPARWTSASGVRVRSGASSRRRTALFGMLVVAVGRAGRAVRAAGRARSTRSRRTSASASASRAGRTPRAACIRSAPTTSGATSSPASSTARASRCSWGWPRCSSRACSAWPSGSSPGYFGGRVDDFFMRLADIQLAFPFILLAIAVIGVLGPSLRNIIIVIGVSSWVVYARVVRGEVLSHPRARVRPGGHRARQPATAACSSATSCRTPSRHGSWWRRSTWRGSS